jgi:hypothetical protein
MKGYLKDEVASAVVPACWLAIGRKVMFLPAALLCPGLKCQSLSTIVQSLESREI